MYIYKKNKEVLKKRNAAFPPTTEVVGFHAVLIMNKVWILDVAVKKDGVIYKDTRILATEKLTKIVMNNLREKANKYHDPNIIVDFRVREKYVYETEEDFHDKK